MSFFASLASLATNGVLFRDRFYVLLIFICIDSAGITKEVVLRAARSRK